MLHGDNKDIPVEVQEALYPVQIETFEWRVDSAGAGKHRGGLGIEKVYRVLSDCNGYASFERHHCAPWGLAGGQPGVVAEVEFEVSGRRFIQNKISRVPMKPGDRMFVRSGAGGGYGEPAKRDKSAVQKDIEQGYISRDYARKHYRV